MGTDPKAALPCSPSWLPAWTAYTGSQPRPRTEQPHSFMAAVPAAGHALTTELGVATALSEELTLNLCKVRFPACEGRLTPTPVRWGSSIPGVLLWKVKNNPRMFTGEWSAKALGWSQSNFCQGPKSFAVAPLQKSCSGALWCMGTIPYPQTGA